MADVARINTRTLNHPNQYQTKLRPIIRTNVYILICSFDICILIFDLILLHVCKASIPAKPSHERQATRNEQRSTFVENPRQINLFMQNKPNFKKAKMSLTIYITIAYGKLDTWFSWKNKANSNPIKANFKEPFTVSFVEVAEGFMRTAAKCRLAELLTLSQYAEKLFFRQRNGITLHTARFPGLLNRFRKILFFQTKLGK